MEKIIVRSNAKFQNKDEILSNFHYSFRSDSMESRQRTKECRDSKIWIMDYSVSKFTVIELFKASALILIGLK